MKNPRDLPGRAEVNLLLSCARPQIDAARADEIRRILGQPLDWAWVVGAAVAHGTMPLLYWNLSRTCGDAVPRPVLEGLRDQFRANAVRSIFLAGELLLVLDRLRAHGISAVPFKGPVLAASAYGNLTLRQFADLDILVQRGDAVRASGVLAGLGYRPDGPLGRQQEASLLGSAGVVALVREGSPHDTTVVELHCDVLPRFFSCPLDLPRFWQRLTSVSLSGRPVDAFAPEDLLLILCVHGSKHLWERLAWVCDVAESIRVHSGLDWDRLGADARALGAERMVRLGLLLASDLLEAPLPRDVSKAAYADAGARALATQVVTRLFAQVRKPAPVELGLFHLRMRERWRDRVRYAIRLPLTPSADDCAMFPLPTSLSLFYGVLRPLRLITAYGLRPRLSRAWRQPRSGV